MAINRSGNDRQLASGLNRYDPDKHGPSIGLMRKAIEAQLSLLDEHQLKRLLLSINSIIVCKTKIAEELEKSWEV